MSGRVIAPATTERPEDGSPFDWRSQTIRNASQMRHRFTLRDYLAVYGIAAFMVGAVLRHALRLLREAGWSPSTLRDVGPGFTISTAISAATAKIGPRVFNLYHAAMRAFESVVEIDAETWGRERFRQAKEVFDAFYRAIWRIENLEAA